MDGRETFKQCRTWVRWVLKDFINVPETTGAVQSSEGIIQPTICWAVVVVWIGGLLNNQLKLPTFQGDSTEGTCIWERLQLKMDLRDSEEDREHARLSSYKQQSVSLHPS